MDRSDEAARFQTALALANLGVRLKRQTLRRRAPDISDEEVDAELRRWLAARPLDSTGHTRGPPDD